MTVLAHYSTIHQGSVHITRVHGPCSRAPVHTTREHGTSIRPVNTGSVYRTPVYTGRVGKKHCTTMLFGSRALLLAVTANDIIIMFYLQNARTVRATNTDRDHGYCVYRA